MLDEADRTGHTPDVRPNGQLGVQRASAVRQSKLLWWCSQLRSQPNVHLLATVLIPFDAAGASIRPLVARDAATFARLDTLLFRYEQPEEQAWGVDSARGFKFDWWALGGRWNGWGREVRTLMTNQRLRPTQRPIPRFLAATLFGRRIWVRSRFISSLLPVAIVTPYGEWKEGASILPAFGKATVRQRKAKACLAEEDSQTDARLPGLPGDSGGLPLLNPTPYRFHAGSVPSSTSCTVSNQSNNSSLVGGSSYGWK